MRSFEFTPEITFKCPFCGLEVMAAGGERAVIIHLEPMCKRFDDLEPDEFLRAARLAKGSS